MVKETTTSNKEGLLERFVPILLVLTVALAFTVGVLWQKVASLEGGKGGGKTAAETTGSGSQPDVNGKLSADQTKKVPPVTKADHLRGSLDAEVYLVEYSDLECPFCKRFHSTAQQALAEYQGKVAWVYRHFPLDTLHSKADKEAEAVECAFDQKGEDGFWQLTDKIFEVTSSNNGLDLDDLPELASQVGLDRARFKACFDSGKFKEKVEEQYQGGVAAGVTGTPGNFVINKKGEVWVVPGAVPFETLKATIDQALASK